VLGSFDSHPDSAGGVNTANSLSLDAAGNAYVSNIDPFQIEKFDPAGNLVATIGAPGSEDGQFKGQPIAMAVDGAGRLFVSETLEGGRVQVFDADGRFLTSWGAEGEFPFGVVLDGQGNVYIDDYLANTVLKFRLLPPLAPPATDSSPTSVANSSSAPVSDVVVSDEWEIVRPGGDCECADGTEYVFFVRNADPAKVVFFLQGGGACFSADTCNPSSGTYDPNVDSRDDPALLGGIFDFGRPDNPFGDYSVVFVPYCTGDVHLGTNAAEYSPELTVQHKGWVNGTAGRDYLAENFPDAAQVVVVGASAGSIAAPPYAGVISDQLPDAQITVFADGSGAYPDATNPQIVDLWGSSAVRSTFPEYTGEWSLPRYFVAAGLHDREIVMARFDFAFDAVQAEFMTMIGADTSDLKASMDSNEALIEEAGVTQHSYTAPGDNHTVVLDSQFYDTVVTDVPLVDWVTALIGGEPMDDVHCEDCEARG
jgi:Pectinacetylesterase